MPKVPAPLHRADAYSRITAEIVAAIEAGAGTWSMPWHYDGASTARPTNVASSRVYRGISSMARGSTSGLWGTYRAWAAVGAQVRAPKSHHRCALEGGPRGDGRR
jgi:antirestriction protein ArdC